MPPKPLPKRPLCPPTVAVLRKQAAVRKIKGRSKMNKSELCKALGYRARTPAGVAKEKQKSQARKQAYEKQKRYDRMQRVQFYNAFQMTLGTLKLTGMPREEKDRLDRIISALRGIRTDVTRSEGNQLVDALERLGKRVADGADFADKKATLDIVRRDVQRLRKDAKTLPLQKHSVLS